jgi:hypothetical protein
MGTRQPTYNIRGHRPKLSATCCEENVYVTIRLTFSVANCHILDMPEAVAQGRKIALLTDAEVKSCLNGILKGLAVSRQNLEALFASTNGMVDLLRQVGAEVDLADPGWEKIAAHDDAKLLRMVLVEMSERPELAPRVSAWLESSRPKLLEPVTTALVLAGIIALLQTEVEIARGEKNGKKYFTWKLHKKPTTAKLLQLFAGLTK